MKNKMKMIFTAALAVALTASRALADTAPAGKPMPPLRARTRIPSATMASLFGDPVIAKGKGVEVKQSALDELVLGLKSAAAARNEPIPPQQLPGIESPGAQPIDPDTNCLLQKATDADKAVGQAKAEEIN